MGKPTGFLEYQRVDGACVPPLERIKNFHEFHSGLAPKEQQLQGARCMACGVPFCQSGMISPGENQLFSGVYLQGMPGAVRGCLHLQSQRRSGGDKGQRACHY